MVENSTRSYTIKFLELKGELHPSEKTIKDCQVKWWKNVRDLNNCGFQMTSEGFLLAKNELEFSFLTFEIGRMVTFEYLLKLDKRIRAPWYVPSYGEISIMESYVTTQLILLNGNFAEFWKTANTNVS